MNKKNLTSIVLGFAGLAFTTSGCTRPQQRLSYPERVLKIYVISGKVKGESTGEFTYEFGSISNPGSVRKTEKGQSYTFVLETDEGLKAFTSEYRAEVLNALINPGDEVKVEYSYFPPLTERDIDSKLEFLNSAALDTNFSVIEINGKKLKEKVR